MENKNHIKMISERINNEKPKTFSLEFLKLITILMSALVIFYLIKIFIL